VAWLDAAEYFTLETIARERIEELRSSSDSLAGIDPPPAPPSPACEEETACRRLPRLRLAVPPVACR
jgi:hypothetical protein